MKTNFIYLSLSVCFLIIFAVGCGEGTSLIGPGSGNPYACDSDPEFIDNHIASGDYIQQENEDGETIYVRVLSDSVVEVIYDQGENGDVRVETYGVVSRSMH